MSAVVAVAEPNRDRRETKAFSAIVLLFVDDIPSFLCFAYRLHA